MLSDEEYSKKIKEKELVDILNKELLPRHFCFEKWDDIPGNFRIFRKFPWASSFLPQHFGSIYIYRNSSLLDDEVRIKEKHPLYILIAEKIAREFSKVKGREMKVVYLNTIAV